MPALHCAVHVLAATYLNGRTDVQCLHRWQKVLNPLLVKGGWTPEVSLAVLAGCSIGKPCGRTRTQTIRATDDSHTCWSSSVWSIL